MNALAAAFQKAGVVPAWERLTGSFADACRQPRTDWTAATLSLDHDTNETQKRRLAKMATQALKSSPRSWDGAKDAFFKLIRSDADLLWELFAPYRAQAIQPLLTYAASELRELERAQDNVRAPAKSGHAADDGQMNIARHEGKGGGGHGNDDSHKRTANPSRSGMDAVAAVTRLSLLDTFKVNGMPIGDATAAEAIQWARSQQRNVRFVQLLTANLPRDQPIRNYRKGDEVQAIYEQASQEVSDAE